MIQERLTELRLAFRVLSRMLGTTLLTVLTLSVGIGLPALMYSLVDRALLAPLPFAEGDRIVRIGRTGPASATEADYTYWSDHQGVFEAVGMSSTRNVVLSVDGAGGAPVSAAALTASTLPLLRVQPVLGRGFTEADAVVGAQAVVLLGYTVWQQRMRGDPGVIGRTVRVDGRPADVVGVMPSGFGFPIQQALWTPLGVDPLRAADSGSAWIFGRLRDGVTPRSAARELSILDAQRPGAPSGDGEAQVSVVGYTDLFETSGSSRALAGLMLGVAFLVLLVACSNVTTVLLARASARSREVAIRRAMGASRARIAAQFWVEVSVLAAMGGLGGTAVAGLGAGLVRRALPTTGMPFWIQVRVEPSIVVFVVFAAGLAAILAGVIPVVHASGENRHDLLKNGSRGGSRRQLSRVMSRVIGVEMAVSFVLLVGAGLFLRSAMNFYGTEYPFDPDGVESLRVRAPDAEYTDGVGRAAFLARLEAGVADVPGVSAVALTTALPGVGAPQRTLIVEGANEGSDRILPQVRSIAVTPDFFPTFRTSAATGRLFDAGDRLETLPVAVVNVAFAEKYFPNGALGRRVRFDSGSEKVPWATIVGVVPDLMAGGMEGGRDEAVYHPLAQAPTSEVIVAVRTSLTEAQVSSSLRDAVRALNPDVAVWAFRRHDEVIDLANAQYAWLSALFAVSGALALAMAALGLYGVMAFWVGQRTREIGIRMALGGQRGQVVRLVVGQGMGHTWIGLGVGVALAIPLGFSLQAALFDVPPYDPVVYAGVLATLVATACVGCWVPALRATRVDPVVALSAE